MFLWNRTKFDLFLTCFIIYWELVSTIHFKGDIIMKRLRNFLDVVFLVVMGIMITVVGFFAATVVLLGPLFWIACGMAGVISTAALTIHGQESTKFRVGLVLLLVAIKATSYWLNPEIASLHYLDVFLGLLAYISTTMYCQKYISVRKGV